MNILERIEYSVAGIAWVFLIVTIIALLGLFLLTLLDILAVVTGFAFQGGVEFGEYLLVAVIFLGLGYAQTRGTHIKIELLTSRLPSALRIYLNAFNLFVTAVFFTLMAFQIWQEAYKAWSEGIYHPGWAALAIPTWPPIFVAFLGCVVLVLSLLTQFLRHIVEAVHIHRNSTLRATNLIG